MRKPAGVVRHVAGPDRGGDGLTEVAFGRAAVFAFAAFGDVERNDVIARLQSLDAGSAFDHFAAALVTQNAGESALRVVAGQGEGVGVADTGGDHFQQNFAFLGSVHVDFFDYQGFLRLPGHGCTGFHEFVSCAGWMFFRIAAFSDDGSGFYKILPGLYPPIEGLEL